MEENKLDAEYWTKRYQNKEDGWDIGQISTPLKDYFDQLIDKDLRILIPGCGRSYEGIYLWEQGFKNVYLMDLSSEPLGFIGGKVPDMPKNQLLQENFFQHESSYDLIIEQTLFCAIDPQLRDEYAKQVKSLLTEDGKLVGVFFNRDFPGGPPFGGSQAEYEEVFGKCFKQIHFSACHNSIPPRMGSELFGMISG
jgi:SAM-dependent methyltransferase